VEWVELDGYGRTTGQTFHGTGEELVNHWTNAFLTSNTRVSIETPIAESVLLARVDDYISARILTTMIKIKTPWGVYRWIPRPRRKRKTWRG